LLRLVQLLCRGPAQLFGLDRHGKIAAGQNASLTIVDLKRRSTISDGWVVTKVGWTAYDGMEVTGWPVGTFVRGNPVVWEGQLRGMPAGKPTSFAGSMSAPNLLAV